MGALAPLFTTGATFSAGAGGAAAGAGLAAAAPWLAIPAIAGAGAAYGFSPTVRHWVNSKAKDAWNGLQHNPLLQPGGLEGMDSAGLDPGGLGSIGSGGLGSLLKSPLSQLTQQGQQNQQNQQNQQGRYPNALTGMPIAGRAEPLPGISPSYQPGPVPFTDPYGPQRQNLGLAGMQGSGGYYGR